MKLFRSLPLLIAAGTVIVATGHAAPIISADLSGSTDAPVSFESITVDHGGGTQTTYSVFTYGTAWSNDDTTTGNAGGERFHVEGFDPGSELAALGGSIVNDGVTNVLEGTNVRFGRAITADEVIVITDLDGNDNIALWLVDSTGTRISGTGKNMGMLGTDPLFTFDAVGTGGFSYANAPVYGSAFRLSDFNDYSGSDAFGVEIGSTGGGSIDPTIIALAAIPEPGIAMLSSLGLGALLLRRRRP